MEVETTVSERARREKWRAWARAVAVSCALCPWGPLLLGAETSPSSAPVSPSPVSPASRLPWRTSSYTLMARGMSLPEVLTGFALSQEMGVVIDKDVRGMVSGDFQGLEPWRFLERICAMNNLIWYFEGNVLYVYRAGSMASALVGLKAMRAAEVQRMLRELGVEDSRYPLRTTSGDELVAVSGPPRYVELVTDLIGKADRLKAERTMTDVVVKVFPVIHAWADDISLDTGGDSTQIKGIATMLSDMMTEQRTERTTAVVGQEPGEAGQGEDKAAEPSSSSAPSQSAPGGGSFRPVIKADSRLNVVVVRDRASRMPLYESLIRELDVPVELIEIQVTVVDISRDDALDWELELRSSLARSHTQGAAGQAPGNLSSPDALSGLGLAGALIYTGKSYTLEASLTALREKGKARTVSRPAILTLNNLQAELQDSKSYHVRVVGQEVAELKQVSAGIDLKVRPRIVGERRSARRQIWMTLEMDDGGFESISVDSMPMTRNSTLETQAAVFEGQSLLLGGYLRDIEEERTWGIPYLRDIPWIGFLFGGVSRVKQSVQRMFVLTPHIISLDDPDLPAAQARRLRDVEDAEELEWEADRADHERQRRVLRREELERELERARQRQFDEQQRQRRRDERNLDAERTDAARSAAGRDAEHQRGAQTVPPPDDAAARRYEAERTERQAAESRTAPTERP